jgi:hypothetical protein
MGGKPKDGKGGRKGAGSARADASAGSSQDFLMGCPKLPAWVCKHCNAGGQWLCRLSCRSCHKPADKPQIAYAKAVAAAEASRPKTAPERKAGGRWAAGPPTNPAAMERIAELESELLAQKQANGDLSRQRAVEARVVVLRPPNKPTLVEAELDVAAAARRHAEKAMEHATTALQQATVRQRQLKVAAKKAAAIFLESQAAYDREVEKLAQEKAARELARDRANGVAPPAKPAVDLDALIAGNAPTVDLDDFLKLDGLELDEGDQQMVEEIRKEFSNKLGPFLETLKTMQGQVAARKDDLAGVKLRAAKKRRVGDQGEAKDGDSAAAAAVNEAPTQKYLAGGRPAAPAAPTAEAAAAVAREERIGAHAPVDDSDDGNDDDDDMDGDEEGAYPTVTDVWKSVMEEVQAERAQL